MGWLDKLENGGEFSGTTNKGFNYNGAWGGPAQNGASMPGAVGFSYARTGAPSNGKYAKKTMPSAQDGLQLYDPDKNPEWKGLDERTATIRLNNATKSNTQRAIQVNQNILNNIAAFNESKQNYINQQKELVDQYTSGESSIKELATVAKDKYNFDLEKEAFAKLSPREMVSRVMVDRANAAIASGKGYPLSQDPKNEMTCINGVCTAASEAGVDFSPLAGKLGVVKDARGKDIPQYNVTWAKDDNYTKAGFERVPAGQAPQPGDFAQYEDKRDDSHMDVEHMELVKNVLPTGYESFNNYNQTNNPVPGSGNSIRNYEPGESKKIKEFPDTYYFRLKDEVANKIVHTDPQYKNIIDAYDKFKVSDDYKTYAEKKAFLEANKGRYEKAKEYLSKNTPKSVTSLKSGGVVKDDNGYWNPDNWGKTVEIGSNQITMKGVNQPLIGVSDTGETQYMEPGKDYKFKGKKVTEYPVRQYGGPISDDVQQFHLDYVNSPKYRERLTKSGYEDVPGEIKTRAKNLADVDIDYSYPSEFKKFITQEYPLHGSYYDPENNEINLDYDNDMQALPRVYPTFAKPYQREIEAHELGHTQLRPDQNTNNTSRLNARDKYVLYDRLRPAKGLNTEDHDRNPTELKADLDAYRYMLNKSGKYDAGKQDFTKDHLKKSKKTFVKDRLQQNYSDEDIIWLMNNVADASKSNRKNAKDGAELTKLDQLTNFTNYNKPQPGGWLDNL